MQSEDMGFPDWRQRIDLDPQICVGQPRINGTRMTVTILLDMIAGGWDFDSLLEAYPFLSRDDLSAAVLFANHLVEQFYLLTLSDDRRASAWEWRRMLESDEGWEITYVDLPPTVDEPGVQRVQIKRRPLWPPTEAKSSEEPSS